MGWTRPTEGGRNFQEEARQEAAAEQFRADKVAFEAECQAARTEFEAAIGDLISKGARHLTGEDKILTKTGFGKRAQWVPTSLAEYKLIPTGNRPDGGSLYESDTTYQHRTEVFLVHEGQVWQGILLIPHGLNPIAHLRDKPGFKIERDDRFRLAQ